MHMALISHTHVFNDETLGVIAASSLLDDIKTFKSLTKACHGSSVVLLKLVGIRKL